MKSAAKLVLCLLVLAGIALLAVFNFSTTTTALTCDGNLNFHGTAPSRADIAHVELSEYRWWVHLWSESDGDLRIQLDNAGLADYVSRLERVGDGTLAMFVFWDFGKTEMVGGYRVANSELTLKISPKATFMGKCRPR